MRKFKVNPLNAIIFLTYIGTLAYLSRYIV